MQFLSVRNWDKYQHYSKRRPPWIKIYWSILSEPNFLPMSDASKLHTIAIMLLASQHDNKLEFNKTWISRAIHANARINWDEVLASGFIECWQDASNTLATCQQDASPRARSRETETEVQRQNPLSPLEGGSNGNSENDLFETWYRAYPRHENPKGARKAFEKAAITANDLPQILDWIEKASKSSQWQEKDKIPMPTTFLNQRRWEGDPPPIVRQTKLPPMAERLATDEDKRSYNPHAT